jgi:hypothetical protein
MAIQLPQTQGLRQIQIQKRQVPVQQIIDVKGQNPMATGIDVLGNLIGRALERKAQLQQQAQQVAAMKQLYQQETDGKNLDGITPDQAMTLLPKIQESKNRQSTITPMVGSSLETASPQMRSLAEQMARGNVLPSDIGMRDRGLVVALANEWAQKNNQPFQSYLGNVRKGEAQNLAYGKQGMNALSLNTALGHVSDAMDAYDGVNNTDINALNKPLNWLRKNSNDPNIIKLGLNLNALQGELANVFKNSGGTDQEIAQWRTYLNEDLTPAQAAGAMQKIGQLLNSRIGAIQYQQQNVMEGGINQRQLISPKSLKTMERIGGGLQQLPTSGNETPSQRKARLLQELSGAR